MRDMDKKRKYNRDYYKRVLNGFRGSYKGKRFVYDVKLPKGAVRHHLIYNDEDPNEGIVFCSRTYHRDVHVDEKGVVRQW